MTTPIQEDTTRTCACGIYLFIYIYTGNGARTCVPWTSEVKKRIEIHQSVRSRAARRRHLPPAACECFFFLSFFFKVLFCFGCFSLFYHMNNNSRRIARILHYSVSGSHAPFIFILFLFLYLEMAFLITNPRTRTRAHTQIEWRVC